MNPTWLGGVGIWGGILIPIKWGGCSSLVDNPPVKVNISPKQIIRIYDEFFMVDGKKLLLLKAQHVSIQDYEDVEMTNPSKVIQQSAKMMKLSQQKILELFQQILSTS